MNFQPVIWIIILNWNGLEDTIECLQSLSNIEVSGFNVHILVVDNSSQYDPTTTINSKFPNVKVMRLPKNLGFAGGSNVGIKMAIHAGADYVLLLNNDTVVHSGFLMPLLNCFEIYPNVGIVSPVICYTDNPDKVWFARGKTVLSMGYFGGKDSHKLIQYIPKHIMQTDHVTGCCMLISKTAIQTVGIFDNRFFAYLEDTDLCIRMKKAGFDIMCVPQSILWHKESASTRRGLTEGTTSPLKHYLLNRNRIATVLKHGTIFDILCFFVFANTFTVLYYLSGFALRRRWKKMVWFMLGIVDGINQNFEVPRG